MNSKDMLFPFEGENKTELFQKMEIRKVLHENEWWFSIVDIIAALTDSSDPGQYLKKLRQRDAGLAELFDSPEKGGVQFVPPLSLPLRTQGGVQKVLCWDIEGTFRLIQSVPSKKAEPFKRWLAKVGFERLQEIENPDLAIKRAVALYRAKGYPDDWIDNRINNKASREVLTSEWQKHGITTKRHMAILTDAVSVESLGVRVRDHRELKGLVGQNQNLRDHMTPIELTLTTLGEQATTEIVRAKQPRGLDKHLEAAKQGGTIAGDARRQIEDATGSPVISKTNYLTERQRLNNAKRLAAQIEADRQRGAMPANKPLKLIDTDGFDGVMEKITKAGTKY